MTRNSSKIVWSALLFIALITTCGCHLSGPRQLFARFFSGGPRQLLDTYFTSAIKQDYATTYDCYNDAYKAKVSKDEYIKHRKDASVLQSYEIASLTRSGDTAQANVMLTFAPSEQMKRDKPVSVNVKEDLVRQNDGWKVKIY